MSRWESYTTVRVTSYRDSTLISKPNNPYLLWLLYKQELRVSSYNKSWQDYSAAHAHVSTSKRRAQSLDRRYVLTHTGRLTVNHTYIRLWFSSRLARRSLQASPFGSAGGCRDHSKVRKISEDGYRKWAGCWTGHGWLWISLHTKYICVLHERTESMWCTGVTAARALIISRWLKLETMPVRRVLHMHTIVTIQLYAELIHNRNILYYGSTKHATEKS